MIDYTPLSEREIDVMNELKKGGTNKKVGKRMHLSSTTVATHLNHIYCKLGVHDKVEAINFCLQHKIITID